MSWCPDFEFRGAHVRRDREFVVANPYRGQNANMHMCEAMCRQCIHHVHGIVGPALHFGTPPVVHAG